MALAKPTIRVNVTKRTVSMPPVKQVQPKTTAHFSQWRLMTCPCGDTYELGRTGTIYGCDRCQGITRNPVDGTIIPDPFANVFGEEGDPS